MNLTMMKLKLMMVMLLFLFDNPNLRMLLKYVLGKKYF